MTAATKLTIIVGIFAFVLVGWAVGGYGGAAVGLVIGVGCRCHSVVGAAVVVVVHPVDKAPSTDQVW
jgi:hypothetical protein